MTTSRTPTAPAPGAAQADKLARRYGAGRGRSGRIGRDGGNGAGRAGPGQGRVAAIAAAVIGVLGTAVVIWLVMGGSGSSATVTGSSYDVVSDSRVQVAFSVVREDPEVALRCTVQATDASHAQVGVSVVDVPAGGPRAVPVSVEVTTFARAELAEAVGNGCVPLVD